MSEFPDISRIRDRVSELGFGVGKLDCYRKFGIGDWVFGFLFKNLGSGFGIWILGSGFGLCVHNLGSGLGFGIHSHKIRGLLKSGVGSGILRFSADS